MRMPLPVGLLISAFWLVGMLAGCSKPESDNQPPSVKQSEPLSTIACGELIAEFQNHPEQAKAKYEGQMVQVSGVVREKSYDAAQSGWVRLVKAQGEFVPVMKCEMVAINLHGSVTRGNQSDYERLEKYQSVVIAGRCRGLQKAFDAADIVILGDCRLVSAKDGPPPIAGPLDGEWKSVSIVRGGRPEAGEESWIIADRELAATSRGVLPARRHGPLELRPQDNPPQMDFKLYSKSEKPEIEFYGIYKVDGDKLTICADMEAKKRPAEFETLKSDTRVLYLFHRVHAAK